MDVPADAAEPNRSEATQRADEARYRLLFEKPADAMLLLDGDVFIDCNEAAVKMMHCSSKEQLLGLHPYDISPERQPDGELSLKRVHDQIAAALEKGSLRFEWVHRTIDGVEFPVEVVLTAIPLEGKKVLHVVWRDITERKHAESQRHSALDALRESETNLRSLLQNAVGFAVYRVAVDASNPFAGKIVMVSPSIKDITGMSDPTRFESWFENVHPEDLPRLETANRRAWETCEPYSQTARVYHPEKEQWIWVHTASTPVSNADGKLTHFNGLIIDITEQKRAEEALQHQIAFESIITNISTAFINLAAADTDREINRALQAIGEFTGVDRGHLVLFSADGAAMDCTHEWCAAGIEPQIERTKAVPISDLAWSTARLMQGEIVHLSRIADLPAEATAEQIEFQVQCIRSLIAVPIAYRGAPFGFLRFDSVRSEKTWSEEGIALLKIAGEILANALEHRRGQAIRAGQSQFLELLATGGDFTETLHSLLRIIEEQWPGMLGLVLLVDEDGIHLHHGAAISLPEAYTQSIEGLEIGPMVGSCGTAVYSGKRVIVEDIATDPRWDGLRDLAVEYGLGACWSEPVFSSSGQVIATFAMYYHHARAPTEEELRAIELAAHLVGIAVEHRQAQEALQLAYQTLERRVDERTRELSMLLEVSHNVASTLELGPLLGLVLDQLKTVVDYTGATILALDEEALTVLAYRGLIPQKEALHLRYPLEQAHVNREVIHRREPVRIPDVRGDTSLARAFQETAGEQLQSTFDYIRSWMGVPLMVKERVVGMLALDHSEPNYYTTQQADLALAFANQVAVAMENARLYQRAQELAVVEERSRLARDLHDAVTQTLFSASLIAEVLPRLWERDPQEGQLRLGELRELTRGALAEMRTLLLELRPAALVDAELGDLLRQLAESITGRARVPVTVEMDGECVLLAEVKIALYRIAQEALNNVAKHADASQATVTLRCRPGEAELHVSDDGCGFDPAGISPESLGLGIMRERARVIGAEVDIESQVGRGTQVSVIWKDE